MRNVLLLVAGVISCIASIPYIIDAFKGKTKPNIASWSTWSLLNTIIIVAALASHDAMNTVILGASYLFGSLTILLIAIFKGTRKYTLFDGVCQAVAIIGVILWQLANNPNIALLFVILVDVSAVLPTLRHAYRYPKEETWLTFALAAFAALLLTCLATNRTFAALAITIEATVVNSLLATVIVYRQKTKGSTPPA